ncbi:phosphate propanoyltransferase [Cohnella abietis]|uniref:Phosphate propanoyltransferase n=1 Tax=Cohnella abietis TaxID=2507935 RepID=A0A3T1D8D8_9BACL|nr:phosphate propanoyltransferase [Cohnella abietis]BBI34350.1 propanediol utilization phosphotransacylase [Cohnella abietis]
MSTSSSSLLSESKKVPVGVSARHIHLAQEHVEILFGAGAVLTEFKPLSQPGQFAANETVAIFGPKGSFPKVRILGPARKATQLEVSRTDAFSLGLKPPLRESGSIEGTPGIRIVGPAGEVTVDKGVIVAARHIHFHTSDAERWGIADKQLLKVRVGGERGIVFEQVLARVSDEFALDMHIDTDEGNAAAVNTGDFGEIME